MRNLKTILKESAQGKEFILKFAFEPKPDMIQKIRQALEKYDIVSFGDVKKTIFQSKPLDFYNLDCGEIYMINIEIMRPASQNIMLYDITSRLKVSEALVRVRGADEPLEIERTAEEHDIDFDEEYCTKLTDPEYKDAPQINSKEFMGDDLADEVVKVSVEEYNKDRTPWAEYMGADFSHYFKKANSDVPKDNGPVKE